MTASNLPAIVQTGQIEPIMTRFGPKSSRATSMQGKSPLAATPRRQHSRRSRRPSLTVLGRWGKKLPSNALSSSVTPDMLLRVVDQEVDVGVDLHGPLNREELPLVQREPLAHRRPL